MTDYYIRITDEVPVDYDESLWFKLSMDDEDGDDQFFVLKENSYNQLVNQFNDATINFTTSEIVQNAVDYTITNNPNWKPNRSTNSENIVSIIQPTKTPINYEYIENLSATLDLKLNTTSVDSALNNSSRNPVQNKVINSALSNKVNNSDFNAYKNSVTNALNGKANTTHSHNAWKRVQDVSTDKPRGYLHVFANEQLRLVWCKYYRAEANFHTKNYSFTQSDRILAGYRPVNAVSCTCFSPYMGALVNVDGKIEVQCEITGKYNINFTAMWFYQI